VSTERKSAPSTILFLFTSPLRTVPLGLEAGRLPRGGLDLALGLLQDGADRGVIGRVVRHRGRRRRVFNSGEEKMISLQFSFACKKGNKKTLFSLSLFLSRTDSLEEVEDNGKKKGKR
jgi:hypothetical protein